MKNKIQENRIEDNIRIITAYIPDMKKWEDNFKTRRKRK